MARSDDTGSRERALPLAAILLAAGASRRFGTADKLLADTAGMPLVARVAKAVSQGFDFADVIAVTRVEATDVRHAIAPYVTRHIENPDAETGLASSVCKGIAALDGDIAGVLIVQGDMPDLSAALVGELAKAFCEASGTSIVAPQPQDRPGFIGTPVIWPRAYFAELQKMRGDQGGRPILEQARSVVRTVPVRSMAELEDIDTPEALAEWKAKRER